jgi:ketosteroid isomerase-like protein
MKDHTSRLLILGILCLLTFASFASAQTGKAEAKTLIALDDSWSAAAATRDLDRTASFYAEDASVFPPNAPLAKGREAARKVWGDYFALPDFKISWKTTSAWVDHNLGYTSGTYQDSYTGKDGKTVTETGKYLCVWRRNASGKWIAIQDMWNTDK